MSVGHHGGAQYAVGVGDGVGFAVVSGAALRTPDLFRVMELRAVEGDQDPAIQSGKLAKCLILNQFSQCHVERRIQQLRVDVIEFLADVIVGGNARDAEQRLAGMTVVRFVEAALVVQERRTLHEKCTERRHRDIGELELAVGASARVGQCLEDGPQFTGQIVDCEIHGLWLYHNPTQSTSPMLLFYMFFI